MKTRVILCLILLVNAVDAAEYHVATNGVDRARGTSDQPFRSIQQAADRLQPGDTCVLHGGVYRESVRPANSGLPGQPIRFVSASNETVVVTGLDPVTGWTRHEGHVYRAKLESVADQLFVDGRLMTPAQYPNAGPDPFKPVWINLDQTNSVLRGASLDQPANFWAGGTIWGMSHKRGWVTGSGSIASSVPGELTVTGKIPWWGNEPGRAVLSGVLGALDAEREWVQQNDHLHLWPPAGIDPSSARVEATRRRWAFDLAGRKHIELTGIHLFAASVNLDQAEHCVLDGLRVRYASFQRVYKGGFNRDGGINIDAEGLGIAIGGAHNVLRNSVISQCTGDGVSVWGASNTVENCVIHDCNTSATDCAPITCTGDGHVIRGNTLFNAGRSILVHRKLVRGKILHNHMYNAGLLCRDLGMTYTYQTDGQGTEIAYNRIHHNFAEPPGCTGIYLDDQSQGHIVHHNLIHDIGEAFSMNPPDSMRNLIFHNTSAKSSRAGIGMGAHRKQNLTGSRIFNNIFMGHLSANIMTNTQVIVTNNVLKGTDPRFADLANDNYTLQPDSPAIDLGLEFPPYTDGFTGKAPDAGAFEFGVKPWPCGSTIPKKEWNDPATW